MTLSAFLHTTIGKVLAISISIGTAGGFVASVFAWHFLTFSTIKDVNQLKSDITFQYVEIRLGADETELLRLMEKQRAGVDLAVFEIRKITSLEHSVEKLSDRRNELMGIN